MSIWNSLKGWNTYIEMTYQTRDEQHTKKVFFFCPQLKATHLLTFVQISFDAWSNIFLEKDLLAGDELKLEKVFGQIYSLRQQQQGLIRSIAQFFSIDISNVNRNFCFDTTSDFSFCSQNIVQRERNLDE